MDSSILYMLSFILCLLLSWYLYNEFFVGSSLESAFSDYINSGFKFFFYLLVLLLFPLLLLHSKEMSSGILIGLFVNSKHQVTSPVASILEPSVFVAIGSVLFQFGFKRMSELQLIRDIPRSKIRSVAVGIVEISGRIVSEKVLTTPYSKAECVYFRCELQEYRRYENPDSIVDCRWERVSSHTLAIPFWVKDETGQILVDPEGAEFRISERLSGFLERDGSPQDTMAGKISPQLGDKRFVEHCLSPHDRLYVLGTAAIRRDGAKQQIVIRRGTNNPTFIISDSREKEVANDVKWEMLAGIYYGIVIFGNTSFVKIIIGIVIMTLLLFVMILLITDVTRKKKTFSYVAPNGA